jgi:hypothetical protein
LSETTTSTVWTPATLNALSREELIELFRGLPSPTVQEFDGEFDGYGAVYLEDLEDHYLQMGLGKWLGKGYRAEPYGDWEGHGYNLWGTRDGVARRIKFGWGLGTSMLDGGPCIVMHYSAFSNMYADLDLIDEIRRVDDGLYLGLAITAEPSPLAPDPGGPNGRSFPSTFLLEGPTAPWVGPDDPDGEHTAAG